MRKDLYVSDRCRWARPYYEQSAPTLLLYIASTTDQQRRRALHLKGHGSSVARSGSGRLSNLRWLGRPSRNRWSNSARRSRGRALKSKQCQKHRTSAKGTCFSHTTCSTTTYLCYLLEPNVAWFVLQKKMNFSRPTTTSPLPRRAAPAYL